GHEDRKLIVCTESTAATKGGGGNGGNGGNGSGGGGGGVSVSVADRGCGISAGRAEAIFEPFVTTKPHGMGLGLTVCRSIISAHGGTLSASNNADRGASFHVTLPASQEGDA